MELKEAIYTRRSVRYFTEKNVEKETILELIHTGIQAPSSLNLQPWTFSVIQDKNLLNQLSDKTKAYLLETIETRPYLEKYKERFNNPDSHVFYNAPALITIYAKPIGHRAKGDCSFVAQNIMLTAHSMGLGTCWIGFAQTFLDTPAMKKELQVPDDYSVVAPIIVGYPAKKSDVVEKNEPEILFWK